MAYTLIAFVINANGIGELEKKTFDSVSAAEERMKRWGRYGVEGQCDQPSELAIFDAEGEVVRSWNWRRREPFDPRAG